MEVYLIGRRITQPHTIFPSYSLYLPLTLTCRSSSNHSKRFTCLSIIRTSSNLKKNRDPSNLDWNRVCRYKENSWARIELHEIDFQILKLSCKFCWKHQWKYCKKRVRNIKEIHCFNHGDSPVIAFFTIIFVRSS